MGLISLFIYLLIYKSKNFIKKKNGIKIVLLSKVWTNPELLRACLVWRKKWYFLYSFSVFCETHHKILVWFADLYPVFIFNIQKEWVWIQKTKTERLLRICPFGHFKRGQNQKSERETYTRRRISFPISSVSLYFSKALKMVLKAKRFPLRMHYTRRRISFHQRIHFLQPNKNTHFFSISNLHLYLIDEKIKSKFKKLRKTTTLYNRRWW